MVQATALAMSLQEYWNRKPDGWTAKFWTEACVPEGGLESEGGVADHVIYVVRSNLVNGMPPSPTGQHELKRA